MSERPLTPTLKDLVAVAEEHGWTVEIRQEEEEGKWNRHSIYVRFIKGFDRMSAFASYDEILSKRYRHGAIQHYLTLKPETISIRQLRSRLTWK